MKAVVLGAAAGGGFPQWNCNCRVCQLAWKGDPRVRRATQSSLAVSADDAFWILLNASPDLGAQIAATPCLWPAAGIRHSPISAVVLTNGDVDHVAGVLGLRERQPISIFALSPVLDALSANPIFSAVAEAKWVAVNPGEPFAIGGLSVELFPVPGKVPLYLEGEEPQIGSEAGEAAGVSVRDANGTLVYVPGCARITPALETRLGEADAVLFDGTLFTDDEMIRAGLGTKSGRRMGHMPITGEGGSLDILARLPVRRKAYVHINNSNPVWIENSPERKAVEAKGVGVAYDGMEIVL